MTPGEFTRYAAAIKTYFPRDNILPSKEAMDLWYEMLCDLDYKIACVALKKHVATNKFAPSIADIRESAHSFNNAEQLNEMEAWALVSNAIRNSGYNSVEEFEKLPSLVQKAVGLPSQLRTWALDENYNEEVVSSNFIKCYRTISHREKEIQKIPEEIRKVIRIANSDSYSAQVEGKRAELIGNKANKKQGKIAVAQDMEEVVPMPDRYKKRLQRILMGEAEEIALPQQ